MESKQVRPDAKGRISLGHFAKGVSSFIIRETADHKIILEPQVEIPLQEKWLFDNKEALAQVKRGLNDAKSGNVSSKGSFAKYIDDETKS